MPQSIRGLKAYHSFCTFPFFMTFLLLFYFFDREGGGKGRGKERIPNRLHPLEPEIMT